MEEYRVDLWRSQCGSILPRPAVRFVGIAGILQQLGLLGNPSSAEWRRKIHKRWDHPG